MAMVGAFNVERMANVNWCIKDINAAYTGYAR